MKLPGAPFLAREGGELRLEGHSLAELGARFGTPLFVYSRSAMLAAFQSYEKALQGRRHLVCYAMKANSKDICMAEAKGRGYDTKVMRKVIALRKRKPDEIAEEEAVLELYKSALGMA